MDPNANTEKKLENMKHEASTPKHTRLFPKSHPSYFLSPANIRDGSSPSTVKKSWDMLRKGCKSYLKGFHVHD